MAQIRADDKAAQSKSQVEHTDKFLLTHTYKRVCVPYVGVAQRSNAVLRVLSKFLFLVVRNADSLTGQQVSKLRQL